MLGGRLSVLFAMLLAGSSVAEDITLVADRWYPYNGSPESEQQGYLIDIARFALEKAGHKVKYQLMPWERSIQAVRKGSKNCLVGTAKSEAPDFHYPTIHLGVDQQVFFRHKGSNWQYRGVKSLRPVRLGLIEDYTYNAVIDQYVANNPKNANITLSHGKYALEQNMRAFVHNQLDVVVASKIVLENTASRLHWEDKFEYAGPVAAPSKLYIACSPALKNSFKYIKLISDGITELRNNGQLDNIMARYGLKDWIGLPAEDN